MNAAAQYDLPMLLERAGAQPPRYARGKWGCPKHSGSPSLSVDPAKGLFNCHHAGCDFHGSIGTLARELGLARQLSRAEYWDLRQNRARADHAARALYERVQARRFELLDYLRDLGDMEAMAHRLGPDNPATWDTLAVVYANRLPTISDLTVIENASAADLIRFLAANAETREAVLGRVMVQGGLYDSRGRFLEISD